jgi:hypothetical protein
MSTFTPSIVTAQQVMDYENDFNNAIQNGVGLSNTSSANTYKQLITTPQYLTNHALILNQYQSMLGLRTELDEKLKELNQLDGTVAKVSSAQKDSSVYINVLLVALSSAMIFYFYRNMK